MTTYHIIAFTFYPIFPVISATFIFARVCAPQIFIYKIVPERTQPDKKIYSLFSTRMAKQ